MSKESLRGAIIGCGKVAGNFHLPAWRKMKEVKIVAVCDNVIEAAAQTARQWHIPSIYDDVSEMLGKESLDFVDICTPPPSHCQLAMQAMRNGLHVLIEKPMAMNLIEADEMIRIAKDAKVNICIVHNHLFNPVVQKAKILLKKGIIGDFMAVDIHCCLGVRHLTRQSDWCHALPMGMFSDFIPHPLYLIHFFLGEIFSVNGILGKNSQYPWVAFNELLVLRKGSQGIGSFSILCNSRNDLFTVDIYGTDGILQVDLFTQIVICRRHRSQKLKHLVLDRLELLLPVIAASGTGIMYQIKKIKRSRIGHQVLMRLFINSLLNETLPSVSGEDGRENIRIREDLWRQIQIAEKS